MYIYIYIRHRACRVGVHWQLMHCSMYHCTALSGSLLWALKIEKRGGVWATPALARPWLVAPRTHQDASFFHHFFAAFFNRFLIDLSSIFPPNLPPKTHQNPLKIDAKRHPILDFKCWSIFDRFWLPTWALRTQFGISGLTFSWLFRFSGHIVCEFDIGANLASFSDPKTF